MGKKLKLEQEDPILEKNYKREKRTKQRLEERKKIQQQKAKQIKRKEQLNMIKQSIIQQQQQIVTQSIKNEAKTNFFKKIGLHGKIDQTPKTKIINKKILEIKFNQTDVQLAQNYTYKQHFDHPIPQNYILKETKKIPQSSTQNVKKQMRQLFGKQPKIEQQENQNSQKFNEQGQFTMKLQKQLKKEIHVKLSDEEYLCSDLFLKSFQAIKNIHQISSTLIQSYCDYIYIENKQQTTIQNFRKQFVHHILKHLDLCKEDPKSKGFTNAKILILTPFVGDAKTFLEQISQSLALKEQNKQRIDQFQDDSDNFRISLTISKKHKKIKYFTKFDHANIIIASPLGLRTIVGTQGQQKRQFSFLSSIQIILIDRAHVINMQNWSHLVEIFKCLNEMPKYQSLVNPIHEIRQSFIQQKSRFYRQNIIFSEYNFPELNSIRKRYFENWRGFIQNINYYPRPVFENKKFLQQFNKVQLPSIDKDLQFRLEFFKKKIWSKLSIDQSLERFVIFASTYFEFLKIKSYFQKVNANFESISEHTKKSQVQSKVAKFNNKEYKFLLITQRAYYFEICQISKLENILFYSLPKNVNIYIELLNSIINPKTLQFNISQANKILIIYSKFEALALERIIGTIQAQELVSEKNKSTNFIL